jgi:hypothetical protein
MPGSGKPQPEASPQPVDEEKRLADEAARIMREAKGRIGPPNQVWTPYPKPSSRPEHVLKEEARLQWIADEIRLGQEREEARRQDLLRAAAASAADPLVIAQTFDEAPASAAPKLTLKAWLKRVPRNPGESDADWARRVFDVAASRGTALNIGSIAARISEDGKATQREKATRRRP